MFRPLSCALVLALVIASLAPARAAAGNACDTIPNGNKIDPALCEQMDLSSSVPLAVVVEAMVQARPDPVTGAKPNEVASNAALAAIASCGMPVGALKLINGAAGFATAKCIAAIASDSKVTFVFSDKLIKATGGPVAQFAPGQLQTKYPREVAADSVWQEGVFGAGVAIAVLDSGVADDADLGARVIARANFAGSATLQDDGGHGTHVAGIVAGDGSKSVGQVIGIAPKASIVDVRVLNRNGTGRISSVVRGIEWTLANKDRFGVPIRVINLSLGAPARTTYRDDPLTSAVEMAWKRGLVVVVASGNDTTVTSADGPPAGCAVAWQPSCAVTTPGIDPFAITVGAIDDVGTSSPSDDHFRAWSKWATPARQSTLTVNKPDVVAPGRRIESLHAAGSYLATRYPERTSTRNGATYFRLTGTSMSTAVVSGAVALLLSKQPTLRPDQVKAILAGTTQQFATKTGSFPPPEPAAVGAGLINANWATFSKITRSANHGLRPANGFARAIYPVLYGDPSVRYRDASCGTFSWDSVAWDSVAWDCIDWDSVAWDSVAWDSVAWDSSVAWDTDQFGASSVAWDCADCPKDPVTGQSVAWDSSVAWDGSKLD